jgi:hypothetical protein
MSTWLRQANARAFGSDNSAKELRENLTPKESFLMWLMPASQLASWGALAAASRDTLLPTLQAIGLFYAAWALRNRLTGNKKEKGQYTYGTVVAGAALGSHILAGAGVIAVADSILLVLWIMGPWPLGKVAHVMKKTLLWALLFKLYLISMATQMGYAAGLLLRDRVS